MGRHVAKVADATVVIDDTALIAALERVRDVATSTFVRIAVAELRPLQQEFIRLAPVRRGRFRDATKVETAISEEEVVAAIRNTTPYASFVKFSVRTEKSLDAEARRVAYGAATAASGWPWAVYYKSTGRPANSQDDLVRFWRSRLTERHGRGAPSDAEAGRNAWTYLVGRHRNRIADEVYDGVNAAVERAAKEA